MNVMNLCVCVGEEVIVVDGKLSGIFPWTSSSLNPSGGPYGLRVNIFISYLIVVIIPVEKYVIFMGKPINSIRLLWK